MKPDFTQLPFGFATSTAHQAAAASTTHTTAEGITLKASYTAADLSTCGHLGFGPGVAPFLGGPYAPMYTTQPWTIR